METFSIVALIITGVLDIQEVEIVARPHGEEVIHQVLAQQNRHHFVVINVLFSMGA